MEYYSELKGMNYSDSQQHEEIMLWEWNNYAKWKKLGQNQYIYVNSRKCNLICSDRKNIIDCLAIGWAGRGRKEELQRRMRNFGGSGYSHRVYCSNGLLKI